MGTYTAIYSGERDPETVTEVLVWHALCLWSDLDHDLAYAANIDTESLAYHRHKELLVQALRALGEAPPWPYVPATITASGRYEQILRLAGLEPESGCRERAIDFCNQHDYRIPGLTRDLRVAL